MPNCHLCNATKNVDRQGKCSICGTSGYFCVDCAWWELGPKGTFSHDTLQTIEKRLPPVTTIVIRCPRVQGTEADKVISQCELMKQQCKRSSVLGTRGSESHYQLWRDGIKNWKKAVDAAISEYNGIFVRNRELDKTDCILHDMVAFFLSAFQLCVDAQRGRLLENNHESLPINLHDAAPIAAIHYGAHGGSNIDCAALRHVDTMEQYMKGNMKVQVAHCLILTTPNVTAKDAAEVAIRALMVYLTFVSVRCPYEKLDIPNKNTFSPATNGASGIVTKRDIERFVDREPLAKEAFCISLAARAKLRALMDSFRERPDPKFDFKFSDKEEQKRILEASRLSNNQKMYLLSIPNLDYLQGSACKKIIRNKVKERLFGFLTNITKSGEFQDLLEASKLPVLFTQRNLGSSADVVPVIDGFIKSFREGRFLLQTCATNIDFIQKQEYKCILSLYEQQVGLSEVLAPCQKSTSSKDKITGVCYRREHAEKAADNRKKVPFPYLSWRIQKDRMAHGFLPMDYSDYDVTAAISQTFPLPEPDLTYGDKMIVWKEDLLHYATFKVGDSGLPRRSALLLLFDLLYSKNDLTKTATFNLLMLSKSKTAKYDELVDGSRIVFQHPRCCRIVDVESHLYGSITIKDAKYILYPCAGESSQQELGGARVLFGENALLYDRNQGFAKKEDREDAKWLEHLIAM